MFGDLEKAGIDRNWWKRKLASLGYAFSPIKKEEHGCIICGKYDKAYPQSGTLILCDRCMEKAFVAQQAFGTQLQYDRRVALNVLTTFECNVCKRKIYAGMVYYLVYGGRVCAKCCWKKLSGHQSVMKIYGERMW